MTAAAVALCNEALVRLGEAEISSFDDGTALARSCARIYPTVADAALAGYPWRFTLTKARLARQLRAPAGEWLYAHALPADLMVLRGVFPSAAATRQVAEYELFEGQVYSGAPDLWADYQRGIQPELWPATFRAAIVAALAADLAIPVAASSALADLWHRRAFGTPSEGGGGGLMGQARRVDSQQQPPQRIGDFPLILARFGGG